MKKLFLAIMLLISVTAFAQNTYTRTPVKAPDTVYVAATHVQGNTRIGIIGNTWHPVGLIVNHQFVGDKNGFGLYATFKSNYEATQLPHMNQYNMTGGFSFDIFKNTCDLLLGASYVTEPENVAYAHPQSKWGFEALLMTEFTDNNFRLIFGFNSNNVNIEDGLTFGFAYQF